MGSGGILMNIEMNGPKLIIGETTIDLTPYQGRKVTVFQEDDGTISLESKLTHQITICELMVPAAIVTSEDTGEIDSEGMPVMREVVQSLDLTGVEIHEFALGGA
jgi:hypothetical protein